MSFGLVAALALAATAAEPAKEKKYVDPNEYASYGPGTASKAGDPTVAEWQKENEAAINALDKAKIQRAVAEILAQNNLIEVVMKPANTAESE